MPAGIVEEHVIQEHDAGEKLPGNALRVALAPFDYALLAFFSLLLVPAFIFARLPFRLDVAGLIKAYWGELLAHSIFVAIVLLVLGNRLEQTLIPVFRKYQKQKARIAIALAAGVMLYWTLGFWLGFLVTADALAIAELMERRKEAFEATLVNLFLPGLYLFWGVILISALNSAVVAVRWAGTYDHVFKHLDWVLFHLNVSTLSHWTLGHTANWFRSLLEFGYYGFFAVEGAVLFLSGVLKGQSYAVQYVRAMIIAYAIALLVFIVFPSTGPYFICPDHSLHYPRSLVTYRVQMKFAADVRMFWSHNIAAGTLTVGGYYIAFPCMHAALATICTWFCRPWRWVFRLVLAWNALFVTPAIILLEWHYMIGMFGGVATAFLAIWLARRISRKQGLRNSYDASPRVAALLQ